MSLKGPELDPPTEDPWLPSVLQYLTRAEYPTLSDILTIGVGVPTERVAHKDRRRAKGILLALGWERGAPQYAHGPSVWYPPPGWAPVRAPGQLVPLVRPVAK